MTCKRESRETFMCVVFTQLVIITDWPTLTERVFFSTHISPTSITFSCQLSKAHGHSLRAVWLESNAKLSLKDQLST